MAASTTTVVEGVASLAALQPHGVSGAAVRQAIGAWAYTLGAGERRPGPEDVRAAIGVAGAIQEMALDPARRRWRAPVPGEALTAAVPQHLEELATRSGFGARETAAALDLLAAVHALSRQVDAAGATVTLTDAVLAPASAVAALDWGAVRGRLEVVGASIAPALAVLRELAAMSGPAAQPGDFPAVRASVRDLEDSTGFGRSTVGEALGALDRAGLVEVEARAGRTTRFRIRPAAVGAASEPPRGPSATSTEHAPAAVIPQRGAAVGTAKQGLATASANDAKVERNPVATPGPASAAVFVGEFAGTPIHAPPGTPLVIECDSEGRWTCRVGPFLTLGPVIAPE